MRHAVSVSMSHLGHRNEKSDSEGYGQKKRGSDASSLRISFGLQTLQSPNRSAIVVLMSQVGHQNERPFGFLSGPAETFGFCSLRVWAV